MKNIVILNKENRNSTRINFKDDVPYISYRALADIKWLKNEIGRASCRERV